MPLELLSTHLVNEKKIIEPFWQKTVRVLFRFFSTILIILNSIYLYFWEITIQFLGWEPINGAPDPKDLKRMPNSNGNFELKEQVVFFYDITNNSLGLMLIIFLIMIPISFVFIFQVKNSSRLLLFIFGAIAMLMSCKLVFGGFLGWWVD